MRDLSVAVVVVLIAACGGKKQEPAKPVPAPAAISNQPVEEPPPQPAELSADSTGSPACDRYLRVVAQLIEQCSEKMAPAVDALIQSRDAQREAFGEWKNMNEKDRAASIEAASAACDAASDALTQSAAAMDCPLAPLP